MFEAASGFYKSNLPFIEQLFVVRAATIDRCDFFCLINRPFRESFVSRRPLTRVQSLSGGCQQTGYTAEVAGDGLLMSVWRVTVVLLFAYFCHYLDTLCFV